MYETQNAGNNGFAPWDVDGAVPKINRGKIAIQIGEGMAEAEAGTFDYQVRRPGDPANALFWRHVSKNKVLPRGVLGSWSFAYVAKRVRLFGANKAGSGSSSGATGPVTGPGSLTAGTGRAGGGVQAQLNLGWLPLQNNLKEVDKDFEPRNDVTFLTGSYGGEIPGGVEAAIIATTGHGERHPVAITPGGPLIAHHEGPTPPKYSRHVFDIDANGDLDLDRHQGLHSFLRVRGWVEAFCKGVPTPSSKYKTPNATPQLQGGMTLMLNATKSEGDNTGYLATTFSSQDATMSHESSGPLRPATKQHLLGVTSDIRELVAGAIDTSAYYTNGQEKFDGPLEFIFQDYIPPSRGPHPYVVELRMDNDMDHGFLCGTRKNMWRWETWIPVTETPPCFGESQKVPIDSQGNPDRTTESVPAVFAHAPYEGKGMIFHPRADVLSGKPTDQRGKFARI